jgi:hypothetical protein
MKFEVEGRAPSNESDKKAVMAFLSTIDPAQLSSEVLDSYGWGDEGDPISTAIEILKRRVEEW